MSWPDGSSQPLAQALHDFGDATDQAVRAWAGQLTMSGRLEGVEVAVVVALRPAEPVNREGALLAIRSVATAVRPALLSGVAVAALVRSAMGAGTPDARCEALLEASGGNPFYLGELLRAEAGGPAAGRADAGRAPVGGLVLLGDSALHTNPTAGRGVSLAFAQAQHLATTLDKATDPLSYAVAFDAWTHTNIGAWYGPQAQADASLARRMQAAVDGKPSPPPDPMERLRLAIFNASRTDARSPSRCAA
jgi:2-polyprenyl-6-methoxyphenol hydroxylase-like FAD-dependent oxidoreductase